MRQPDRRAFLAGLAAISAALASPVTARSEGGNSGNGNGNGGGSGSGGNSGSSGNSGNNGSSGNSGNSGSGSGGSSGNGGGSGNNGSNGSSGGSSGSPNGPGSAPGQEKKQDTEARTGGGPASNGSPSSDQDRARQAVEAGRARPLGAITPALERQFDAQLIDVRIEERNGLMIYRMKMLSDSGRVFVISVDAATGRVL